MTRVFTVNAPPAKVNVQGLLLLAATFTSAIVTMPLEMLIWPTPESPMAVVRVVAVNWPPVIHIEPASPKRIRSSSSRGDVHLAPGNGQGPLAIPALG